MPKLDVRILPYDLTSHAGLALVGRHLKRDAQLAQRIDPRFPVPSGLANSAILTAYLGLLCIGKSDFDAIEPLRSDRFFPQALALPGVPSSPTLRQRIDALAVTDGLNVAVDEANVQLLKRARATITPEGEHVTLDIDVFTLDNSNTKKEGVSYTYAGFDGYAPIAAYLGQEGWCLGLELRPGSQHSASETDYTLQRVLPRALALTEHRLLLRADSGFDSARLLGECLRQRDRLDLIVKWNPRGYPVEACHAAHLADPDAVWTEPRPGKRSTTWIETIERRCGSDIHALRRVMRLTERTIDRDGQRLLLPKLEIDGWWSTLDWPAEEIIASYQRHGTHEQFHSEFKTDLDLERLPSGKFASNDLVLTLAMLAYNVLRLIGQRTLLEPDSPVRHPAKRRRLKTVLQEIILRAGRLLHHARRWVLGLGCHDPCGAVFSRYWQALGSA